MNLPDTYAEFRAAIEPHMAGYIPFDLEVERNPKTRDLKRDLLVDYVETGGVSGGSCWDTSDPRPYSTGKRLGEFKALDAILMRFWPEITFFQYRVLYAELVKQTEEIDYAYYGNRTDYAVQYLVAQDLYTYLRDLKRTS